MPSKMTVLIVDEHPSFRANARLLLEAEGYVQRTPAISPVGRCGCR
jgi:CheY-like chemotaxis protein